MAELGFETHEWTSADVVRGFVSGLAFMGAGYGAVWMWNGGKGLEPRRRQAWVLSLFSSGATSLLCLHPFLEMLTHGFRPEFMETDSQVSVFLVSFFAASLVLDIIFGLMHYAEHLELLSGWIHHVLYLVFIGSALHFSFTRAFSVFLIEEIPTFMLALGTVAPAFRTDYGFGMVFFALRVVLHTYMTWLLFVNQGELYLWATGIAPMAMHYWWMYAWFVGQMKRAAKKKKAKEAQD